MAVQVVAFDVVVVVLPVLRTGVVRRVDVDRIDLAAMRPGQRLEDVVVLAVDDGVAGLVAAARNMAGFFQARIDRVAEFRDDNQVIEVYAFLARSLALRASGCLRSAQSRRVSTRRVSRCS